MLTPVCSDEVGDALAEGSPIVALESTIFSHLGLPSPYNRDALVRCSAAVRAGGAIPAVTAVLDGVVRLGFGRYTTNAELTEAINRIVAAADAQTRIAA